MVVFGLVISGSVFTVGLVGDAGFTAGLVDAAVGDDDGFSSVLAAFAVLAAIWLSGTLAGIFLYSGDGVFGLERIFFGGENFVVPPGRSDGVFGGVVEASESIDDGDVERTASEYDLGGESEVLLFRFDVDLVDTTIVK